MPQNFIIRTREIKKLALCLEALTILFMTMIKFEKPCLRSHFDSLMRNSHEGTFFFFFAIGKLTPTKELYVVALKNLIHVLFLFFTMKKCEPIKKFRKEKMKINKH